MLGLRDHGDFFVTALHTAAQDELAICILRIGDFEHFDLLVCAAIREGFKGFFLKRFSVFLAASSSDVDEVIVAARFEQGEVGLGGKAGIEDHDGLELGGLRGALIKALKHAFQGGGVGGVAFKDFVSEGEAVLIKGHADGDLAAVITLLFVFAVFGLWVGFGKALEVGVGDVVEDDAALEIEEVFFVLAELSLDHFAMFHEGIAGAIETVFGGFANGRVEEFGQRGTFGPFDECPFAEWLNEAVGNHELGGGDGGGLHAAGLE